MNELVYLGSMFCRDGRYEMEVERRIAAGKRANGPLAALMRRQCSVSSDVAIRQ